MNFDNLGIKILKIIASFLFIIILNSLLIIPYNLFLYFKILVLLLLLLLLFINLLLENLYHVYKNIP